MLCFIYAELRTTYAYVLECRINSYFYYLIAYFHMTFFLIYFLVYAFGQLFRIRLLYNLLLLNIVIQNTFVCVYIMLSNSCVNGVNRPA